MSKFIKNERTGKMIEYPPYKCKMCGEYEVQFPHDICKVCGWQDDFLQNDDNNYDGGANRMSFNQYKEFWNKNKDKIIKQEKPVLTAIKLSKEYYKEHFEKNKKAI